MPLNDRSRDRSADVTSVTYAERQPAKLLVSPVATEEKEKGGNKRKTTMIGPWDLIKDGKRIFQFFM